MASRHSNPSQGSANSTGLNGLSIPGQPHLNFAGNKRRKIIPPKNIYESPADEQMVGNQLVYNQNDNYTEALNARALNVGY